MVSFGNRHFPRGSVRVDPAVAIAALASVVLTGSMLLTGLAGPLERRLSDLWFDTSGVEPTGHVVIVDTARAAVELGDGLRVPRARLATLIEIIAAAGSDRILIDLGLTSETTPADDARLEAALQASPPGSVALTSDAVTLADRAGVNHWQRTKVLQRFARHARPVASDLAFDPDGKLRRFGVDNVDLAPLGSSAEWLAGRSATGGGSHRIDFGIDALHIPMVDALDLLQGRAAAGLLAGRRVVLASYAAAFGHQVIVPRFGALPRPLITALSAESLMREHPLHAANGALAAVFILLLAASAPFWLARLGPWFGAAAVFGFGLCAAGAAAAQQTGAGLVLPVAAPILAAVVAYAAAQVARNAAFRRVREALAGFCGRVDLRLAFAMHETGEALVTFTPEGKVISMNVAARTLFAQAGDGKGTSIADLFGGQADDLLSATRSSRPGQLEATIDPDDRGTRHLDLTVNTMRADAGAWIGVASIRDVTKQREQMELLRRMTLEDPLTGLLNRLGFERALAESCARLGAGAGEQIAVLLCDLDGFKSVNDTLGHQAGDDLLREIAQRLRLCTPSTATVARLGGDEFGLVVRADRMGDGEARLIAESLVAAVARPIRIGEGEVSVGISIGIALYAAQCAAPESLLRVADDAMYRAKRARAGFEFGRSRAA